MTRSSSTASPPVAEEPDRRRRISRQSGVALCAALTLAILAPAAAVAMPIVASAVTAPADVAASDAAGVSIPNLADVRGDITLPESGSGGSSLAWTSSDPAVISADGLVERPAHGSDPATVTLQVTATFGDSTATHDYVATVTPLPADEPLAGYFFPHFVGESTPDGEEIYFAASAGNDPEEWISLNDGEPVLASTLGEQGLRDPFLIRSPEGDRFFLLATDLKIYGGGDFGTAQETGSRSIMVWESDDLVNWSEQREIVVSPENAGNTWAPEAYWDQANEEYIVYWASALYPADLPADQRDIATSYQRMMYATTRDFVTFSEPQVWIDEPQGAGRGMIDSTVALDDGVYYRFTKDESDFTVREEQSTELRRTQGVVDGDGWGLIAEHIGVGQPNPWGGTFTNGEGPSVFKSNTDDSWYLLQDQPSYHGGEGYMLFESSDLASGEWTSVPDAELPESPRHGTVLPVTASEYQRLLEAYQPDALVEGVSVTPDAATLSPGETAAFEASVTPLTAEDRSVIWSSSDETVATVDAEGIVTAIADGIATITARAVSGAEGAATVTVETAGAPELPSEAWVDEFDGETLDSRWAIEGEAPDAWSLTENPGTLTVHSQSGDTYQATNTAKNVFLVDVPAGDFTAFTSVTGAVSRDFQGAGLFVMKDFDNYVRAGLTNVSFAPGGPTIIENGVEQGAVYASTFTARPGSTHEYLRVQRTGDEVVTSYWTGHEWAEAARATVGFDAARIGLYALAAGSAPSHEVTFDYFALVAPEGADIVPEGMFTFEGSGDTRHLTAGDGGALRLDGTRPLEQVALTATEVDGDAEGEASAARPVVIRDSASDRPLVVDGDRLALGADGAEATAFRLTDVGGGKAALHTVDGRFIVLGDGGALVVGDEAEAARLTVVPVEITEHTIEIDTDAPRIDMSDDLYGIFYEDINYAADGGIYAELVRNRSFEFNTADNRAFTGLTAWEKVERGATGSIAVGSDRARWLNDSNRVSLTVQANGPGVGVRNIGFNRGFALEEGESYDFSVWARSATAQQLTVAVENTAGTEQFALGTADVTGDDTWRKVEVRLTSNATTDAGRLVLLGGAAGSLQLDMVSLFPVDTWVGPVNGPSVLRKDLAEKVAELEPSFLRFPGGCVTNVGTFNTYLESDGQDRRRTYQWKETIGPVEERPTNWNFWGYNQSYGLGYLEYLEWAEDLGATPLPVLSVGANGCGSNIPEMTDDARINRWVDDTVDLIEFAKGDVTTEWGAKRAALGHPEPFDLRYLGLGNEENTDTFQANFPRFRDAVAAAWPDVKIISNSGPDDTGARFDELWQFNREQGVDLVDEHYYNDPSWFLQNSERYDEYDREGPHVFLGEYASRGNTFANALSEAAYMTGLERNSDVVDLASYAPMFANEDHVQWSPDMMWFDNDESWGSVNYYTQQMFMKNVGDEVVPSTHTEADAASDLDGGVFLSTWNTSAAYDDVRVTDNATGDELYAESFDGTDDPWAPVAGSWAVANGEYVQSSATTTDARSLSPDAYARDWSNYTLELDARKTSGAEGFLVGFAAGGPNDFYWWNLGGWNNTRSVLQHAAGGSAGEVAALEGKGVETGRDYHVKIVVAGSKIELYLDGVLQLSYTEPSAHGLYQVVTRDAETGELRLKVVNPTGSTARTQVSVAGGLEIADEVGVTEMVGAPGDMNTKADPEHLVPVDREWSGGGNEFGYDFPAYSITFLSLSEKPHPSCEVSYTLEGDSKKAFSADLTITNTGDAPYTSWELGFEFAEKQTLRNGHDAWWRQSGASVTANNLPWNGTIQPGETVGLGFNGRLNGGGNSEPAAFSVNGDACTVK